MAVKDSVIAQVIDNTAPPEQMDNLGIFIFARMFFPDAFKKDFAEHHYEMMQIYFSMLDPRKTTSMERKTYFICHREAAKSTMGTFLIPIYNVYLKNFTIKLKGRSFGYREDDPEYNKIFNIRINEDFIIIVSETGDMAEGFISDLKEQIDMNKRLPKIFGEKHPRYFEADDDERMRNEKWTKKMFATADGTIIKGIGSGMQVRGRKLKNKRPSLILADDLYSEKNVKTEDSINKTSDWFYKALLNSLNSNEGKIMVFGTIVHPESIPAKIITFRDWNGIVRPIIGQEELNTALAFVSKKKAFDSHYLFDPANKPEIMELQKTMTTLSWPSYHPLIKILQIYYQSLENHSLQSFYQEYMNQPIAPEEKGFEEDNFIKSDITGYIDNDEQFVRFTYNNGEWRGKANLYIGLDLASALTKKSDDTVICVCGYARCLPRFAGLDNDQVAKDDLYSKGVVFPVLMEMVSGKFDLVEYDKLFANIEKSKVPGIGDWIKKICQKYKIEMFKAEANGQQETSLRFIKAWLQNEEIRVRTWFEYINMDKKEKILSIVKPIFNQHKIILLGSGAHSHRHSLYSQLLMMGMAATRDDEADSFAIGMKNAKEPNSIVYDNALDKQLIEQQYSSRYDRLKEKFGKNWRWYA